MPKYSNDTFQKSIDDIIQKSNEIYKLEANAENKHKYEGFLKRQKKKNAGYFNVGRDNSLNSVYLNLLADELFIYSILIRERQITIDRPNSIISLIDSRDKLRRLKLQGNDGDMWDEIYLFRVHQRRESARKKHPDLKLPNYRELINYVGNDKDVVKMQKGRINYFPHVTNQDR